MPVKLYLVLVGISVCSLAAAAEGKTNHLAIYLVADKIAIESSTNGTTKPDTLKLLPEPVLADTDFVAYDRTNHTFEITLKAAKRLVRRLADRNAPVLQTRESVAEYLFAGFTHKPFVLTANGKRIYVGVFWGGLSSTSFVSTPMIAYGPQNPLTASHKSNIQLSIVLFSQDPAWVAKFGRVPDVRDDPRILEALRSLGL